MRASSRRIQSERLSCLLRIARALAGVTALRSGRGAGQVQFSHVLLYAGALIVIVRSACSRPGGFGAMGVKGLTITALGDGAGFRRTGWLSLAPVPGLKVPPAC